MILKNYTSDVPISQTISRIQNILVKAGVSQISMDYGIKGEVVAVTFTIFVEGGKVPIPIRMPADVAAAQEALWLDYADGDRLTDKGDRIYWNARKKKCRADFLEQGKRTAWKLVQDWIEVQLSMIALKQGEIAQVFLPYVWDGKQTFYSRLKNSGFAALMPPKET